MARGASVSYLPVGQRLENGHDVGGARIYPFDPGLAIAPPAYYGDYVGDGAGLMVTPPVAALTSTAGAPPGAAALAAHVSANPWGSYSPLPWVIGGLVVGLGALYAVHYREK